MNIKKVVMALSQPFIPTIDRLFKPIYKLRRTPFSLGYNTFKWEEISASINNIDLLKGFSNGIIPKKFGIGLDERVVEYPWIFSRLSQSAKTVLDAGSTFNFESIINHNYFSDKKLNIYTFYPENKSYPSSKVSYEYGDLRKLPYADESFDCIVSHSTIEHIEMDNSIYGYNIPNKANVQEKSYEYLTVIKELERCTKHGGELLLTFPFGKFKNYGFFQQFDGEMIGRVTTVLNKTGNSKVEYLLYSTDGWRFASETECVNSLSHNPHTGEDKGNDGAAHCRCVCCIKFTKSDQQ